jgi:hypothetical protein
MYTNIVFCAEVEEVISVSADAETVKALDDFLIEAHKTRVEILRDFVVCLEDDEEETLADFFAMVDNIKSQATYHQPSKLLLQDAFMDHPSVEENSVHNCKSFWSGLLLYVLLSFFGLFWFKFAFLVFPALYYKAHILALLALFEQNPDLYFELVAEFYDHLVKAGIIYD